MVSIHAIVPFTIKVKMCLQGQICSFDHIYAQMRIWNQIQAEFLLIDIKYCCSLINTRSFKFDTIKKR